MSEDGRSEKKKAESAMETAAFPGGEPPQPADPLLGKEVGGRYVIDAVLGKGGMGVVYTCKHKVLKKKFVIKVIRIAQFDPRSDIALKRFKREAQAIARVEHPNVVQVVDYDVLPDNTPYIVMEFIEGQDLERFMRQYPDGMPVELFRGFMNQLCDAMETVHACGIVHRDLKPSNIMVQQTGNAFHLKILDFGLASLMTKGQETSHFRLTTSGQMLGTPAYMAPEQCREMDVSEQTDIYALGLIAYEMLAGQPAVQGKSFLDLIRKQTRELPPLVTEVRSDVPVEVATGIEMALQKTPEDRLQSMRLFRQTLGESADGSTSAGLSTSYHVTRSPKIGHSQNWLDSASETITSFVQRRPRWIKAAAIGIMVCAFGWFFWPRQERPETRGAAQQPDAPVTAMAERELFDRFFEKIDQWPMEHASKPVAFIPDSNKLVVMTETGLVKIWDYQNGVVLHRMRPFEEGTQDVVMSSDGRRLLVVSAEGMHTAWIDLETYEIGERDTWKFLEDDERIVDVTRVPKRIYENHDPRIAVLTSKRLRLFEAGPEGAFFGDLDLGQTQANGGLVFSNDGKRLAFVSVDREALVFDVMAKKLLHRFSFQGKGWMQSMAFSPDSQYFAMGTRGNEVLLFDLDQGKRIASFAGHDSWVVALWFLPQDAGLLSYSVAGDVHQLRLPDLRELDRTDIGGRKLLLLSPTGILAETDPRQRKLKLSRFLDPHLAQQFSIEQSDVWAMTMSPDGNTVFTGSPDASISAIVIGGDGNDRKLTGHLDGVTCLDITQNGDKLISSSDDFSLGLWDVVNWTMIKKVPAHEALVNGVVLAPDETHCVTASSDRLVKIWTFPGLEEVAAFPPMAQAVQSVAFSPSGTSIAAGDWSGQLALIDVASQQVVASARIVNRPIYWIEFFPENDSKMLCSTLGGGGTLWVELDGTELRPHVLSDLVSLLTPVNAFGRWTDGANCFAVCSPEAVQIFDAQTLEPMHTIKGLPGVQFARFHPTRRSLFCVLGGGRLWSYDLADLWAETKNQPQ